MKTDHLLDSMDAKENHSRQIIKRLQRLYKFIFMFSSNFFVYVLTLADKTQDLDTTPFAFFLVSCVKFIFFLNFLKIILRDREIFRSLCNLIYFEVIIYIYYANFLLDYTFVKCSFIAISSF